ncbi:MAG TPA: hypothetical protein VFW45_19100 [Candidatus Polarisedimenticolia bacterium]|nr:hypothetical protein [Candidatus Polarisedimenticolia bacterium]
MKGHDGPNSGTVQVQDVNRLAGKEKIGEIEVAMAAAGCVHRRDAPGGQAQGTSAFLRI